MTLGILMASENDKKQTDPQDSCFIGIDLYRNAKHFFPIHSKFLGGCPYNLL